MQTGYKKRVSKVLLSHPRMFYDASNASLVMPETPEQGFFPKKKENGSTQPQIQCESITAITTCKVLLMLISFNIIISRLVSKEWIHDLPQHD